MASSWAVGLSVRRMVDACVVDWNVKMVEAAVIEPAAASMEA